MKKIIIPDSMSETKTVWAPKKVKINKALILADVHVPFHSAKDLEIAINYGIEHKCTDVILLGDFIDAYSISHFERDINLRDFSKEVTIAKEILTILEDNFKGQNIYLEGNHCNRYNKYLNKQAPELLGLESLSFRSIFGLENWTIVNEKRPLKIGNMYLMHGDQISASGKNKAQGIYNKTKSNCIIGHYHKTSIYSEVGLDGKQVTCYSVGCLSKLNPLYNPCHNSYNLGFGILDNLIDKKSHFTNYRIEKGRVIQ